MAQDSDNPLDSDPGDPVFAEIAERMRLEGNLSAALAISLRGLSSNPSLHKGRLILAHILYQMGCIPFAVREVRHLVSELPASESLKKLLTAMAPDALAADPVTTAPLESEQTIATTEFAMDDLELLGEEKSEK